MFRGGIGAPEILLIVGVVLLLFGGRKLPELARGSGRALRIFKSEVKELGPDKDKNEPETADDVMTRHQDRDEEIEIERDRAARRDQA